MSAENEYCSLIEIQKLNYYLVALYPGHYINQLSFKLLKKSDYFNNYSLYNNNYYY